MKRIFTVLLLILLNTVFFAQTWQEMMNEPGRNFYEIQAAFNEYWKDKDITEKGKGYKPFKRWEDFVGPRVYPSGDLSLISTTWQNYESFLRTNMGNKTSGPTLSASSWTLVGPMGAMTGSVNGLPRNAGRDNFITFDPGNPSVYWCGSPAGGLWKTTNNGGTWATNTDNLPVIGCTDLAIDPSNTNIMYLATGDGYGGGDTYSIGVLKSTDGGLTWNTTGLSFTVNQQRQMRRLLINPNNPQILIAVGNFGVQRSTDAGTTWTSILNGNFYDAEFQWGNPNVVFVAGAVMYRSTNGGASFTLLNTATNGIPGGSNRMNIGITAADPNYVYVLAAKSSNSGLLAVLQSTNGGINFTTVFTNPDILANSCNPGSNVGGQAWYDLAFAVSPIDKNEVVVGGINTWRSTNGGTSFTNIGCWTSTVPNPSYIHADQHELEYTPSGTLYSCNDGGIFELLGSGVWADRTSPRNIAQMYKIGLSSLSPNLWITGHQDNGTNYYNGTNYVAAIGGDGMDCFIDRTNNANMFGSLQNGGLRRSTNGGVNWSSATTGLSGGAGWVTPWKQDPVTASMLYAGYSQMFVSNNQGATWTQLTNTGASGYVVEFAIAPSNNQVIYVIHGTAIRKTTNGGTTWTGVTSNIPTGSGAPTFITIDPSDENTAWVTLSGYSAANKVFQTTNGGASWTNITYNLPNLPANCSVYQPGTNDRIYIGMDVGVYVKDNSQNSWTLYNSALPNAPIRDMEISPAAPNLLRAATFGRGVYEVEVIKATAAPVSGIAFSGTLCAGTPKKFTDLSSEDPTSWNWSVSPSAGVTLSSSNIQNPTITFPAGGTYTVSLTASNGFGTGTATTQIVTVNTNPVVSISSSAGSPTVCLGEEVLLTASGAATYTWLPNKVGAVLTLTFSPNSPTALTYTVNARNSEGCVGTETVALVLSECTGIEKSRIADDQFTVFPNPASKSFTIKSKTESAMEVQLELQDATGKIVMQQPASFKKDKHETTINISQLSDGVYLLKIKTEKGSSSYVKIIKE